MIKSFKNWQLSESQVNQSQFLTTKEEIEQWLEDNVSIKGEYVINDDMTVDVKGDVGIKNMSIKKIEVEFNEVSGDFNCYECKSLTSLEGAPKTVGGNFSCGYCTSLTTLEGAPKTMDGYFSCYDCTSLKSLEGIPMKIEGIIDLDKTPFSKLKKELNKHKELLPLYSVGFTKDNYKEPEMQEKLKKLGVEHKVSWSILDSYILDTNIGGSRRSMAKLKKGF